MKITAIKQQVKRAGRYSIYVEGKYSLALGESELLNARIKVGQSLSKTDLDELKNTAELDKAYGNALNLIARRPRSEWEITNYLQRKSYNAQVAKLVLERLVSKGYLDDEKFARAWAESRRLLKPVSKRRLVRELKQKRVSDGIIEQVLSADDTDEQTVLKELVAKKRRQTRYQDDQKLTQYLVRQGFNYGDVKTVLEQ